jgi:hypothetical protein
MCPSTFISTSSSRRCRDRAGHRPANPPVLPANFAAFERLLAHNRGARIIWAHAGSDNLGQWTVELSRRALTAHPNLFMSLRMAPAHVPRNHPLNPVGAIKPGWLPLLRDFPDRFVIGGDQFFVDPATANERTSLFASHAAPTRQCTNVFLAALPEELAALPEDLTRGIATGNAARLYKL